MAAAEYYSNAPMGPTQHSSPYLHPQSAQQPPLQSQSQSQPPRPVQYPQPPPQNSQFFAPPTPQVPPPPYQAVQNESRPSVHFEDRPGRPQRHSFSSQAPIPVTSDQQQQPPPRPSILKPTQSPQLRPTPGQPQLVPPQLPSKPQSYSGAIPQNTQRPQRQTYPQPQFPPNPQYLSPYSHTHSPQYASNGYASDPESHRRRRRRHSNDHRDSHRGDRETRGDRDRKDRSRSTNADGFLGAAGGGLIGDLIFPGLGTVGGAVVGWLGGKDYGKHRKYREEKLDRDQDNWEHKFHRDSDDRGHARKDREYRSYERHNKYDH